MKVKMLELEAGRGNCDVDALAQIRDMRAHIEVGFFTDVIIMHMRIFM